MNRQKEKALTLNGLNKQHLALIACSLGMIITSIYLLMHYFQTLFPEGLSGSALCNINGFWSCDAVLYSPASAIWGTPIASFGLLAGCFLLFSSVFPNIEREGVNHVLCYFNLGGCLGLFFYSFFSLGHLCPFCTVYYLLSGICAFLFFRHSSHRHLHPRVLALYALLTFLLLGAIKYITYSKNTERQALAASLVKDYDTSPNWGNPQNDSPFRLVSATKQFAGAPLQLSIFSDFQCPACKLLSESLPKLEARYRGKLNIQYYFYPLDNECNPDMNRSMHPLACTLSYIATCLSPERFAQIHDAIFQNQETLTPEWANKFAKENGAGEGCVHSPATREKVISLVREAAPFSIHSTPTMILNGVKLEGAQHLETFYVLMDELLRREGKR